MAALGCSCLAVIGSPLCGIRISGRMAARSWLVLTSGQGAVCTFETNAHGDVDDAVAAQLLLLQPVFLLRLLAASCLLAAIPVEGDRVFIFCCLAMLPLAQPPTTTAPTTAFGSHPSFSPVEFAFSNQVISHSSVLPVGWGRGGFGESLPRTASIWACSLL